MKKPEDSKPINRFVKSIRKTLVIITFSLLSVSCRDKIEIFSIQREGIFSFSKDNIVTQYANDVKFYRGKQVLYYYDPSTFELYTRYLLEASGTNATGGKVVVSIEVDFAVDQSYVGIYRPQYEKGLGGINSFNLLDEVSPGVYNSYNLDPDFLTETYIRVERQNLEEKLILGDFFTRLVNDRDSADKITLYEGTFKDISYAK